MQLTEKQKSEGWRIVKFGDIAKSVSKRVDPSDTELEVYVGLEHLDPDNLRITRRGVPGDVTGQKLRVRSGQIIFGKRRAYQRKVAVADFEGICSAHALVLEAIPEAVLPEYLPFFMQSDMFMERAVAISEGSLSPTIKWKTLANQEFPLPPRPRQEEILCNIDHFVRYTRDLLNVISKSEKLLRVFYFDYLKKELNLEISNTSLFDVTSNTSIYKLNDLLTIKLQNGLFIKKGNKEKERSYFLNVTDIYKDDLELEDLEIVTCSKNDLSKYLLEGGDVVFNRSSLTRSGIGWPYLFNGSRSDVTFDCHLIRAKFDQSIVLPEYAYMYSLSPWARRYFLSISQTTTMTTIGQDELGSLPIAVPSLEKQKQICDSYSKIFSIILSHKKEMKKINRMQGKYINRTLLGEHA